MMGIVGGEFKSGRVWPGYSGGVQPGQGVPGQYFEPATELPALLGLREKIHAARDIRFDCEAAAGVRYRLDRDDMRELLGHLLDNAGKWADETGPAAWHAIPEQTAMDWNRLE